MCIISIYTFIHFYIYIYIYIYAFVYIYIYIYMYIYLFIYLFIYSFIFYFLFIFIFIFMLHVYIYIYVTCLCLCSYLYLYLYLYDFICVFLFFSVCASMYMTYLCAIDKQLTFECTTRSEAPWPGSKELLPPLGNGREGAKPGTKKKRQRKMRIFTTYLHNICTISARIHQQTGQSN